MESVNLKKRTSESTVLYLIAFLGLGMVAIFTGIFLLTLHEEPFLRNALIGSAAILFGFAYTTNGVLSLIWSLREYDLNERGIEIRYLKRKVILYPWQSITKICVWKHNSSGMYHEYIWCAVGNPKRWYPQLRNPNSLYEMLHWRTIISVEFSQERLDAFKQYFHGTVQDYRRVNDATSAHYYESNHPEDGDFSPKE